MYLWRIVPSARIDDTRWEDHPVFAEVIVRAETAAMARVVAGKSLFHQDVSIQFGGERDAIFISAFNDEKLYRVSQIDSDPRFHSDGPRELLHSVGTA